MIDKIIVIHSDGEKDNFTPRKISDTIIKETGIDEDLALRIQNRIANKLYKLKQDGLTEITTTQIRAEVSSQLLKEGVAEEPYVIIKESDIMNLLTDYDKNNANQVRTAGALEYSLFEMIAKRYMNTQYSDEWREAKEYGLVYNHDAAQELYKGLNCFTLDPRFVFKKGLRTYGDNHVGVVSKPPKHFDTALEICEQTLGLAVPYIAGGVSIACFNYMLAPYVGDLPYESIYQSLQGFMFQMNQSHKNRGSQSMFSSITLDMICPDFLKDQKAIGPGGIELQQTYGDFDKEARLILDIITNISFNGDGEGKPIFFPNLIYNIDGANLRDFENVFDLSAKFSLPYFCSPHNNNVDYQSTLGCLDGNEGIWCKINDDIYYKTFKELSILLNANVGLTPVDMDLKVLTIDDNKKVYWEQVKNFIWNKNRKLYKISLSDEKSFICDDKHELLTTKGINPINVFDCSKGSNVLGLNYMVNNLSVSPDLMACFYGFYLGDGAKSNNYGLFSVSKEDKYLYLKKLFDELGIDYTYKYKEYPVDERHPTPNQHKFYFHKSLIDEYKPDLTDKNVLAGLLSGMISSDGYIRLNKGDFNKISLSPEFVSTNFEYIKLFEYCCFNLGLKFKTSLKQGVKDNHSDFKRVYISCNKNTVHIFKQLFLRSKQKEIVDSVSESDYRLLKNWKSIRVKSIDDFGYGDSFCIEVNGRMVFGEEFILSAQCRSALPNNWTGDPNIDCMGTGNSVYTTISLPAVALKAKEEGVPFTDVLENTMQLVHDYNLARLDWIKKLWYEYHVADFMIQEDETGTPMYRLEDATIVVGYLGMSECLEILGYGPLSQDNNIACQNIMKYMKSYTDKWKEEEHLRWGLFQTPCESAAGKLAQKMVDRFGFKKSFAKGTLDAPYYTNSNHVAVDNTIDIIERIKIEGENQPLGPAGNIMNLYLGESYAQASALASLCEKIRDNTKAYFWAFTSEFSLCPKCFSTFKGNIKECPFCHVETDVFSRITGYVTNTKTWNKGKISEFKERKRY